MRIRHILLSIPLVVFCFTTVSGARTSGGVNGKVTVGGAPPRPKSINMSAEPGCAKMYSTPPTTEDIVVGPGGALENVVVYVSAGAPPESTPPDVPVSITQKGCRFAPHVVAMQVNQQLNVVNSDSTSHNIHPLPTANREWNKAQPPGTSPLSEMFAREEFIPVKCNIHPWMHSYFVVLKTSHYAVTGESGAFALNNLPPGKYTITAWHETLGTQTQEITLSAEENAPVNFVFKTKP